MSDIERDADPVAEALKAMSRILATDSRDWALDRTDARLWAMLCGWGDPDAPDEDNAWQEVAERHGWGEEYVEALVRRRRAIATLQGEAPRGEIREQGLR